VALADSCDGPDDIITRLCLSSLCGGRFGLPENYKHPHRNSKGFHPHYPPRKLYNKIDHKTWDEYLKVSSIRNPWDRVVSNWWWWVGRGGKGSFSSYIKDRYQSHGRNAKDIGSEGGGGLPPMTKWLNAGSSRHSGICTNFLIRFERLDEDYLELCNRLGIASVQLPHAKGGFRKNKTPYQKYYTEETQNIIAHRYKGDIKLFGYSFND